MDKTLVAALQQEVKRQEAEFVKRLNAVGQSDLAKFYRFIASMRETVAMAENQPDWSFTAPNGTQVVAEVKRREREREPSGFVLRTAVRNQIQQFAGKRFSTRQMFEALNGKYPEFVDESKLPSVSATLANLTTKGELEKTVDGQRKVRFMATDKLRLDLAD